MQLNLDLQNKYDLMVKQKQIDTDGASAKYELLAHERNQLRSDVDELQQARLRTDAELSETKKAEFAQKLNVLRSFKPAGKAGKGEL